MIRNGLLLTSVLLVSSLASAATEVARIYCENETKDASLFWTMRSDSSNRYKPPGLSFQDAGGNRIRNISNPIPVRSDNLTAELFFVGELATGENALYKANVDIPYRTSQVQKIFTLAPAPSTIVEAFAAWDMPRRQVALSKNLFAASRTKGTFEVIDAKSLKTVKAWKIDADQMLNPEFSSDGKWVKLEIFDNRNLYSTRLFSLTSDEVLSLPASGRQTQVGLSFIGNNAVAWTESDTFSAQTDKVLTLKAADFSELRKGQSRTLFTEKSKFLRALRVFEDGKGDYFTVSLKEEYLVQTNSPEKTLTKGEVLLISISNRLSVSSTVSYTYDPTFYYLGKSLAHTPYGVLSNTAFNPYANQIIFSLGFRGGLASLDLNNKTWSFHGVNMANICYNPVIGAEVTND